MALTSDIHRQTDFADHRVWLSPCASYEPSLVEQIVSQHCDALGLSELITPGCTVAIKPNLVMKRSPDEATTTHPEVVAAIVRAVKRCGAGRVIIAESSGGLFNKVAMSAVYSGCGMTAMAEREGAELNLDFDIVQVSYPQAVLCRQFSLIKPIIEADVVINVAKLKTHAMTGLSGSVKNLFGCVPGLIKPEMHCQYPDPVQFQQMIVDLCTLVSPTISFLDAVDCMEGDGPTGGSKRFVGALLASRNPFAMDVAACRLIGVEPLDVAMLRLGVEQGLCPRSLDEVELFGDLEPLCVADFVKPKSKQTDFLDWVPDFLHPVAERLERCIVPRPYFVKAKCIGCGKCAESCPQHTIIITPERKAQVDYSKCIKCFCCQEMCPIRAIEIKHTFIVKL